MNARTNRRALLVDGAARHLDPLLVPAGFKFVVEKAGGSSGGPFASGAYENGSWRIELHVRQTLGLIRFSHGPESVDLGSYLRAVGRWDDATFPRADGESVAAFSALAADVRDHCAGFVSLPSEEFAAIVARAEQMNSEPRSLP